MGDPSSTASSPPSIELEPMPTVRQLRAHLIGASIADIVDAYHDECPV
jgi:hypothetical protein